ncbi:CHAD domain-containing protein, partial [Sphingopyxis sp.]|uniref:CYTH and CHAD domain-containing protein n=1 Tax=Sphingopyxis sp. TaxID=1908224 RepID=UPI002EDA1C32
MANEVELKLELSPAAADLVAASGLLAGTPGKARQISTYFDTDDQDVAKAGFSLRIRRTGKKRIQTIKADGASAAGLFVRSEWECAVGQDIPVLDYSTPLPTLLGDAADAIAPVFEVRIDRQTWLVEDGGASIELVLDCGKVVAGERSAPVCEIELELKSGDSGALFDLARKIDAAAPVRLGVLTKSERGYRLSAPVQPSARAEPVALKPAMTAAEAFGRIIQSCIRHFRLNEALLLTAGDPHALHQARVALRRMRSAFSIFRPVIGDDGAHLRDELRWLASTLGEARDLDVLFDRAQAGALRDRIAAARETAYDRVREVLESPRARLLMFDIARWISPGARADTNGGKADGNQPARAFAGSALRRYRRKVRRLGRDLAHLDDETRHEVRKNAKKLRYATEFFASLFERKQEKRRYKRFLAALEELQDRLGALNDLVSAPDVLERAGLAGNAEAAGLLAGNAGKKKLIEQAEAAHD